jgi:hypothetical protein
MVAVMQEGACSSGRAGQANGSFWKDNTPRSADADDACDRPEILTLCEFPAAEQR